ncbi:hypothetical protein KIN20_012469 [Parelaphostrongylus tenuis]|uniref:Uncharacterized protein n=1 Tax=Parelaphostrongylus tenuis TaxID=148309 RepID=A0AAD5MUT3_PARTN|nr:hypothetical protein KIN20_012469 [Parelaphostrongylus tenuis]
MSDPLQLHQSTSRGCLGPPGPSSWCCRPETQQRTKMLFAWTQTFEVCTVDVLEGGLCSVSEFVLVKQKIVMKASLRAMRQIDSSHEFREIDSKRDQLKRKTESISREITLVKVEKEGIEHEMRKIMSMEMVRSDVQNKVRKIENELVSVYGFHGPSYVDELRNRIASEEKDMEVLRNDLTASREKEQNRMDAAHMEFTKLSCEADSVSTAIEQANRQINAEEKKLQDAVSSQAELAELASKIANTESLLSKLPKADEQED